MMDLKVYIPHGNDLLDIYNYTAPDSTYTLDVENQLHL